jgi:hypothetical protein
MTMLLSLSMILTLMLVRFTLCLLISFLWAAYRDCFHVFLSLCVFVFLCLFSSGFARGGLVTHNLSSLPGLASSVIN